MSFARIAAAAAMFTLLSAAGAMAKPVTLAADTNLRKSPGLDAEVLTLLPKGTTVEVGKCTNGWCETSSNGNRTRRWRRCLATIGLDQNRCLARVGGPVLRKGIVEEVGPPVYGPRYVAGPPVYYRPYYGYGYGPYYGYGWGYRGWGWRW